MYNEKQLKLYRAFHFRKSNIRPYLRAEKEDKKEVFNTIYELASFLAVDPETAWEAFATKTPIKGWVLSHIMNNEKEATHAKLYATTRRISDKKHIREHRPVKVYDIHTKEVMTFPSMSIAGKYHGVKASNIRLRITVPEKIRMLYERYVIIDAEHNFDFLTEEVRQSLLRSVKLGVLVYSVRTRTFQRYSGITAYMRLKDRESEIDNTMRLVRKKGACAVSGYKYLMNFTYEMNNMTDEEISAYCDKVIDTAFTLYHIK